MIYNFTIKPVDSREPSTILVPIKTEGKPDFPLVVAGCRTQVLGASVQDSPLYPEISNIHIGAFCSLADDITMMVNMNHDYLAVSTSPYFPNGGEFRIKRKGQIIIQNDVQIEHHVIIVSGVKIGNGAIITSGTVVTKDVPPYAIIRGNSQETVGFRFPPDQIQELLSIRWWDWSPEYIDAQKHWFGASINSFIQKFGSLISNRPPRDLLNLERKGCSFLLFPDIEEPYSVWESVVADYRSRYTSTDDVTLILRLKQDESFEKCLRILEKEQVENEPDILVVNDELPDERALFYNTDCFITTRSKETVRFTEFADAADVRVLSGVDRPIFDR